MLMDAIRLGSYNTPTHQNKHKKLQVTTTSKNDPSKKPLYTDQNPYALPKSPTIPVTNKPLFNQQLSTNRDTITQTSSQKSTKVMRTNGLSKVQKPNIENSRTASKQTHITLHPPATNPTPNKPHPSHYPQHPQSSPSPATTSIPTQNMKPLYTTNRLLTSSKLQQQNTNLRLQNAIIKQKMLNMQIIHTQQIKSLKQHIEKLYLMSKQLQQSIHLQDKQWIKFQCNLIN